LIIALRIIIRYSHVIINQYSFLLFFVTVKFLFIITLYIILCHSQY